MEKLKQINVIKYENENSDLRNKLSRIVVKSFLLEVLKDGLGLDKYTPCPLLVNMVTAGHLGAKSGKGFYDYSHGTKELVVAYKR